MFWALASGDWQDGYITQNKRLHDQTRWPLISEHFDRSEFTCRCQCGYNTVDHELIVVLENLRNLFNRPITIQSGCRCPVHNLRIKGSKKSQHMLGKACDFTVHQAPPAVIADHLERKYPDKYGIGRYLNFTHIDVRKEKARWSGHKYN